MKVALFNSSDLSGGAAIATYRLHRGLVQIGVESTLHVQDKLTSDRSVVGPQLVGQKIAAKLNRYVDNFVVNLYKKRVKKNFSISLMPDFMGKKIESLNINVAHLFWVANGFIKPETIKNFQTPVVWTLHDMNPFTGGCHYSGGCSKFKQACGSCEILGSEGYDISSHTLGRKKRSFKDLDLTIVGTSKWIANAARESSLFSNCRIELIPNGLNCDLYRPLDQKISREILGLPGDKKIILYSGNPNEERKGLDRLKLALEQFQRDNLAKEFQVVFLGGMNSCLDLIENSGVIYFDKFSDEISQILLYSAADVLVAPSYEENFANTVIESMACGTPVVAFNIGGMPDAISHMNDGYLATPFSYEDLATGIKFVTGQDSIRLSANSRQKIISNFSLESIAKKYFDLYVDVSR